MRKILVLIVSVALLGACGKSSDKKTDASGSPSGTGIRAKVLTVADLPPGFKRTSLDVDKRDTTPLGCPAIDQVDAQYVDKTAHTIEAAFQNGDDATATQYLDESVSEFKTVDEANAYFDAEVAGMNACKTFSSTDEDGTTTGQIQPYPFPTVGDESAAVTFTITGAAAGPGVLVRKGLTIMQFSALHVGNQPGLSGADIEAIVRKGADKL
jgi:hypothetical protein